MERNSQKPNPADVSSRDEIAADWLQRLDNPQLKEEEIQAWLEWFGACDSNRRTFEELQALRRRLREMPEDRREQLKLRTAINRPSPGASAGRRWRKQAFAAAASVCALALTATMWWKAQTNVVTAIYAAPADHHRTVALPDGSSLVLGADAIVDMSYSRERRALTVQRGQAYFEVRHDPTRSFVVWSGSIRVTAVGTAFNVQRAADKVTVAVTNGKVSISGTPASDLEVTKPAADRRGNEAVAGGSNASLASEILLTVGQRAVLPLTTIPTVVEVTGPTSTASWDNDRADFIDVPLSKVLPVINHHASTQLVIDDPRVADLTYSGTVFRSHIDEWVASLPQVYPIRAVPMDDGTVTLVSR